MGPIEEFVFILYSLLLFLPLPYPLHLPLANPKQPRGPPSTFPPRQNVSSLWSVAQTKTVNHSFTSSNPLIRRLHLSLRRSRCCIPCKRILLSVVINFVSMLYADVIMGWWNTAVSCGYRVSLATLLGTRLLMSKPFASFANTHCVYETDRPILQMPFVYDIPASAYVDGKGSYDASPILVCNLVELLSNVASWHW